MSGRYVHIFCGSGMGKTSAAFGRGIRQAGEGKSVVLIQFLKEKQSEGMAEFIKRLEPEVKLFRFEKFPENYESLTEREKEDEIQNIKNGLNFAKKVLMTEGCDVLILDEILGLVDLKVLTFDDIREMIESKPEDMTIIMTGRVMDDRLRELADEIYNITPEK